MHVPQRHVLPLKRGHPLQVTFNNPAYFSPYPLEESFGTHLMMLSHNPSDPLPGDLDHSPEDMYPPSRWLGLIALMSCDAAPSMSCMSASGVGALGAGGGTRQAAVEPTWNT